MNVEIEHHATDARRMDVNATVTLTFTAASEGIANDIARQVEQELVRLAGTRHVPAIGWDGVSQ